MKGFFKIVFFIFISQKAYCQTISANPGWSYNVPAGTITEAGSDYSFDPISSVNQTLVTFSGFGIFSNYRVLVHKSNIDWNSGLEVQVIRTGAGSGGFFGSITGGSAFITLTSTPQVFFTGGTGFSGGRSNIPIQYQIQGLSVLIPVKTHTATIVYTISN